MVFEREMGPGGEKGERGDWGGGLGRGIGRDFEQRLVNALIKGARLRRGMDCEELSMVVLMDFPMTGVTVCIEWEVCGGGDGFYC